MKLKNNLITSSHKGNKPNSSESTSKSKKLEKRESLRFCKIILPQDASPKIIINQNSISENTPTDKTDNSPTSKLNSRFLSFGNISNTKDNQQIPTGANPKLESLSEINAISEKYEEEIQPSDRQVTNKNDNSINNQDANDSDPPFYSIKDTHTDYNPEDEYSYKISHDKRLEKKSSDEDKTDGYRPKKKQNNNSLHLNVNNFDQKLPKIKTHTFDNSKDHIPDKIFQTSDNLRVMPGFNSDSDKINLKNKYRKRCSILGNLSNKEYYFPPNFGNDSIQENQSLDMPNSNRCDTPKSLSKKPERKPEFVIEEYRKSNSKNTAQSARNLQIKTKHENSQVSPNQDYERDYEESVSQTRKTYQNHSRKPSPTNIHKITANSLAYSLKKGFIEGTTDDEKKGSQADIFSGYTKEYEVLKLNWCYKILENNVFGILINILTFYALYADDFRVLIFNVEADIYFDIATIFCLQVFIFEIILSIWGRSKYTCSFFFWMDVISTVSQLFDITWIQPYISFGYGTDTLNQTRAARASKIGSKAARITRILRWIRQVRITKAFKCASKAKENQSQNKEEQNKQDQDKVKLLMKMKEDKDKLFKQSSDIGKNNEAIRQYGQNLGLCENDISKFITKPKNKGALENEEYQTNNPEEKQNYFSKAVCDQQLGLSESKSSRCLNSTVNQDNDFGLISVTNRPLLLGHDNDLLNNRLLFERSVTKNHQNFHKNLSLREFDNIGIKPSGIKQPFNVIRHELSRDLDKSIDVGDLLKDLDESNRKSYNQRHRNILNNLGQFNDRSFTSRIQDKSAQNSCYSSDLSCKEKESALSNSINDSGGHDRSYMSKSVIGIAQSPQKSPYKNKRSEMLFIDSIKTNDNLTIGNFNKRRQSIGLGQGINDIMNPATGDKELEDREGLYTVNIPKESHIGRIYSYNITKRVVMLVLQTQFSLPFFRADNYADRTSGLQGDMDFLNYSLESFYDETQVWLASYMENQKNIYSDKKTPIIEYELPGLQYWADSDALDSLRSIEKSELENSDNEQNNTYIIKITISNRAFIMINAAIGIGQTTFICILLLIGSLSFSSDANTLVLFPIEEMLEKCNAIIKNPIEFRNELDYKENQEINEQKLKENEFLWVDKAIDKIAILQCLGFGEAGGKIISNSLLMNDDSEAFQPGSKQNSVFGFAEIRQFAEQQEVLQEEVVVFVNVIAEIVHSEVDLFFGQSNRSLGDCFLIVWQQPDGELTQISKYDLGRAADFSLCSFLRIMYKIDSSPRIDFYNHNLLLKQKLSPNAKTRIKLGFGLHIGWAIEGAIGSQFKIDASYLSPNVNLASRLEAATKQYGVNLLMSGTFYELLSETMKKFCRNIDRVTVKGSEQPVDLWTIDVQLKNEIKPVGFQTIVEKRTIRKKKKMWIAKNFLLGGRDTSDIIMEDKKMRSILVNDKVFFEHFRNGVDYYKGGKWRLAQSCFINCLKIRPNDTPTKNQLNYIRGMNYIPPLDWQGFRGLTDK